MESTFKEKFGLKAEEMEEILGGVVSSVAPNGPDGPDPDGSCSFCSPGCFVCRDCYFCSTHFADTISVSTAVAVPAAESPIKQVNNVSDLSYGSPVTTIMS